MQADVTREARVQGARLQHGRSGGVLGSWSPATTGFFYCTLSCSPWGAQNIPDGPIRTLGTGCMLNFCIKCARQPTTVSTSTPTVTSIQFGSADSCHQCRPSHSSTGASGRSKHVTKIWVVGSYPSGCIHLRGQLPIYHT